MSVPNLRILIVDDSATTLLILNRLLAPYGKCDTAGDGRQALQMIEQSLWERRPYDVVFLDILMPVMDGHEAARRIQAMQDAYELPDPLRAKLVVVSARGDVESRMEAHFEGGADIFIPKPVTDEIVREVFASFGFIANPLDFIDLADEKP